MSGSVDVNSILTGIKYMRYPNEAKWSIKFLPRRFWIAAWTPRWHEGNGPYLTCGLWLFSFYRGY